MYNLFLICFFILSIVLLYIISIWICLNTNIFFSEKGKTMVGHLDEYHYRLGDVVQRKEWRDKYLIQIIYSTLYRNTLAKKYMSKIKDKDIDYDLLNKIIKEESTKYTLPKEDELIIHLRLGDVIDSEWLGDIDKLLEEKEGVEWEYLRSYKYIEKRVENIKNKVKKIILVTGFHSDEDHTRSYYYLDKMKNFLNEKGYIVQERIDKGSADEDFIYMSNSKYFIPSGGNFSKIIKNMVLINGGEVLD